MKKIIKLFPILVLLPAILIIFNSCKDDDGDTVKQGDIKFQFKYTIDGQDFQPNQIQMINGVAVNIEIANFYVGGIKFHPESGDHIHVHDKYLLVTPEQNQFEITELDEGHYHMAEFFVGVEDAKNDQSESDFTSRASDDPLGMQTPSMHWNWNSGYKYLRIDGKTDTDGDGTPDAPLAFHLGDFDSYDFISNHSIELHHNVTEGENNLVFELDFAKLFNGIDLSSQTDTHVFNDADLAKDFHVNLGTAISKHH